MTLLLNLTYSELNELFLEDIGNVNRDDILNLGLDCYYVSIDKYRSSYDNKGSFSIFWKLLRMPQVSEHMENINPLSPIARVLYKSEVYSGVPPSPFRGGVPLDDYNLYIMSYKSTYSPEEVPE